MEIKWPNVIALALMLAAMVILFKHPQEIGALMGSVRSAATDHTIDHSTMGLFALGLILVALVGVVKILTQNRRL